MSDGYPTHCITADCRALADGPRKAQRGSHVCAECEDQLRRHLRDIASNWAAAHRSLRPVVTADDSESKKPKRAGTPIPVDLDVAAIIRSTRSDVWFLARLILDEREDAQAPDDNDVPSLARWIALSHVPWLTAHADGLLVAGICEDIAKAAKAVSWAAVPLRARRIAIPGLRCTEHGTSELGERIPCDGTLYALVGVKDGLPDLRCTVDRGHVIDPATWTSKGFTRTAMHHGAAVNLRHAITGG